MEAKPIQNLSDAADLAQNMADISKEQAEQFKVDLQDLLKNFDASLENKEELQPLIQMLSLDDASFQMMAPIFLEQIEKSLNNPNDKLLLAQSLNAQGKTVEDLKNDIDEVVKALDSDELKVLSPVKRQFLIDLVMLCYNGAAETEGIAKRTLIVRYEKCHPDAKVPAYAKPGDAGMDVYALDDITIAPGETKLIPIGIKAAVPVGYELQVRPKSGRSLHSKLRIANTPGTIDSGYRDEIGVIVENIDAPIKSVEFEPGQMKVICEYGQSFTIGKGEKFAQLVLSEVPKAVMIETDDISLIEGNRGGGFGSTGNK